MSKKVAERYPWTIVDVDGKAVKLHAAAPSDANNLIPLMTCTFDLARRAATERRDQTVHYRPKRGRGTPSRAVADHAGVTVLYRYAKRQHVITVDGESHDFVQDPVAAYRHLEEVARTLERRLAK